MSWWRLSGTRWGWRRGFVSFNVLSFFNMLLGGFGSSSFICMRTTLHLLKRAVRTMCVNHCLPCYETTFREIRVEDCLFRPVVVDGHQSFSFNILSQLDYHHAIYSLRHQPLYVRHLTASIKRIPQSDRCHVPTATQCSVSGIDIL